MLALTVAVYALFFTMADSDALTAVATWFRNLPLTYGLRPTSEGITATSAAC
ncbi:MULTISPECIES: hypothetical protein [Rhodanobacter]|uniref:hypothetical protein n=1 Tax=Rhodanobacter TaxID=75309 RepID=UPI0003FB3F24|nr:MULTISPECIES: hypothetical protein [Rhodanobacter]UJJ49462.1 hypothetical protein LRK52_09355 [Rhodanobacter denitrificans]UJJ58423.1 hypothetical protein LRK55_17590 [Rhodanobacter denitrificans]UJM88154.1 hypothetical protein LRJ86_07625 [Rhodanobacter denitrificans]UJM88851.1 hypothetical protein LRK24_10290 [Rhodanobacter denitrificans]UJM92176.1 hypothetical protein LRK32_09270 [Rhodanobacter denitrificans]